MGTPLHQALFALERRMPFEEVTLWATALRIGAESGAGMAAVLESLSESMRRKLVLERKVQALTAQGRLQAWVMSLLPVIVLVLLRWVDPHSFATLVHTPGGRSVLCVVVVGQLLGFLHIRRIVRIEV
jgi:tight adherence protein B